MLNKSFQMHGFILFIDNSLTQIIGKINTERVLQLKSKQHDTD